MKFTDAVLKRIGIGSRERARYLPDLRRLLPVREIDTPLRLGHFIAQTAHESSMLNIRNAPRVTAPVESVTGSRNRTVHVGARRF